MPVAITLHMEVPEGARRPREATAEEREEWAKRLQAEVQRHDPYACFESEFVTSDGQLHLNARRHGTAVSAVWGAGPSPGIAVASSLLLRGINGADDAAAVESFRKEEFMANLSPQEVNRIQAQSRPSLHIMWANRDWCENGHVVVAAMGLAAAVMAAPGAKAGFGPEGKSTPEEIEAQRREVQAITDVFGIIQRTWVRRKTLRYTVRPSERIEGRPVEEIMHVKFWIGVDGQGRTLSLVGLVNLFLLLGDYVQKAPNLHHMRQPKTRHTISFRLDPRVIEAVMKQIRIDEPA